MRVSMLALSLCLGLAITTPFNAAEAARSGQTTTQQQASRNAARPQAALHGRPAQQRGRNAVRRAGATNWGGISCVPYVRMVTGMDVRGNGRDWWHNAAGRYARSRRPEAGAVLAFASSGGMSSGHVAVVSRVVNNRQILIDHANWGGPGIRRGSVMQNVSVIDVSEDNSWTQVRVQVGHDPSLHGRAYPTFGFIHNRPDNGEAPAYASLDDGFRRVSYTRPANHGRGAAQRPGTARTAAQTSRQPQASRQVARVQQITHRRGQR